MYMYVLTCTFRGKYGYMYRGIGTCICKVSYRNFVWEGERGGNNTYSRGAEGYMYYLP